MMKRKSPKILVLVLALVLVAGLATVSLAGTTNSAQGFVQQGMMQGRQHAQTALKAVSELTGLDIADIRTQRSEGKSLLSIAEGQGISEQELTDKVVADRKAALEQLKADGKITEAQYQTCLSNMETRIKSNLERTATGPNGQGRGQRAMQGGGQGRGCGMGAGMQGTCLNTSVTNN